MYVGVDGLARKIINGYVGVDGLARKIINGYVGVDGVARGLTMPFSSGEFVAIGSSNTSGFFVDSNNRFYISGNSPSSLLYPYGKASNVPVKIDFGSLDVKKLIVSRLYDDVLIVTKDRKLYVWTGAVIGSNNSYGSSGVGTVNPVTSLTNIPIFNGFVENVYSARAVTFLTLTNDTGMYSCGIGKYYNNGHQNTSNVMTFKKVPNISEKVEFVSSSVATCFMKTASGSVYAVGDTKILLGVGATSGAQATFLRVTSISDGSVTDIKTGHFHTAVLHSDGTVKVTGLNSKGQLGTGSTSNAATFITAPGLPPIKQIEVCANSTLALAFNGDVYVTGDNTYGELGLGSTPYVNGFRVILSGVKSLATAWSRAYFNMEDGRILATGENTTGGLGVGSTTIQKTITEVMLP